MYGPDDLNLVSAPPMSAVLPQQSGVVPRACREVFNAVEFRREHLDLEISIGLSYIEIYGNEVSDLLRGGTHCGQNKVSAQRYVLDGSSEVPVSSLRQLLTLMQKGENQKRIAATAMNERSSRAHSLLFLTLRQTAKYKIWQ